MATVAMIACVSWKASVDKRDNLGAGPLILIGHTQR